MKTATWSRLGLIGLCFILLTGCWDYQPIETLFNVTGIAIDQSKTHPNQIKISLIAVNYPRTKIVLSSEGKSVSDAINHIQNDSSKRVVLSHVQMILFSDAIAKKGLMPYFDLFFRDMQMRVDSTFGIVKQQASRAFERKMFNYPITGRTFPYLINTSETKFNVRLFEIHNIMLQSTASDANFSLPYFKLNKKTKQAELSGLALFHKGKMVHALNREQMKAYMIIRREIMQLTYTYGSGKKSVTFRLHVRPIRVRVKAQHGRLHFTYQITMVDEIVEIEPWRAKPIGRKALQHIEHKVERRLAKNCLKLVRHIQKKHHYDVFWLAEEARVHTPSLYRTARWDQQFSDARFTFHVKIQLKRYGQLF